MSYRGQRSIPSKDETSIILQRYNAAQAHNLIYTLEELRELGIEPDFLMTLLEVFEDTDEFNPKDFNSFKLSVIVDYLRKTHRYYLEKKLPEIEQSIHLLSKAYPQSHPILQLLHDFYIDYAKHLTKHIEVEERELLPYILDLEHLGSKGGNKGVVQKFIEEHHDTEKDLEEVRNAILHYSPPEDNQTLYRILLSQLQVLEKDLAVHALIEDDVLLPRALEMEKQGR